MKRIIVGNWKLYINSLQEAEKLLKDIDHTLPRGIKAEIVICPPVPLAIALRQKYGGKRMSFGTQDVSAETEGAHTGEISARALSESGITYVIVGHVERRAAGDTNEIIAKKIVAALTAGLHPIVCVGERERDQDGTYLSGLEKDIRESLARVSSAFSSRLTIAYDPLWAIGKTEAAPPRVASQSIVFIRKTLAKMWGRDVALKTRIIYGGSVDSENARAFGAEKNIQGLLPGRASVDPKEFAAIIKHFSR